MADKNLKTSARPDLATLAGLTLALGGIIGGLILEGGHLSQILQGTAAMIVFGGTLGAVMVTMPISTLKGAAKRLLAVFVEKSHSPEDAIETIIGYATKARKNGIVSLEAEADTIADPFLRKALSLAVDGTDLQELRKMMELDIALEEQRGESAAKVFEAAGGYAPTIGIIGAVLGLIQVMQKLADIEEVGRGIGVAFVATVYGVGSANIFFLPAGNKIRARVARDIQMKELMLEGIVGIVEGLNPKLIRLKLSAYLERTAAGGVKSGASERQAARAVEA
ncbi:MAG: flagellar motor protein [Acidobacteriales bacterium]|nr:flagellar motor protein [Terriglobales bacterium]